MKVSRVFIKNFRSISETSFNLAETVTAIAGGNESGKSNALKAIERFLNQEDLLDADKYQLSSNEPEIHITFDNFNSEETQNIAWVLRRDQVEELTIKRVGNNYSIVDNEIQQKLDEEQAEIAATKAAAIEAENENDNSDRDEPREDEPKVVEEETEEEDDDDGSGEIEKPNDIESIKDYIMEYLPECELISDVSSLITGDNILIEKIFADKFDSVDEEYRYLTIRSLLEVGNIVKSDLLEPDINKRIQILRRKSANIASEIKAAWSQEDVKLQLIADSKNLVIHFRDGKNIPDTDREDDTKWIWTLPEDRSFGFRWYVTFYAKYLSKIKNTDDEDIVFLIDDAGLGLNKAAQKDLLKEFNKIATEIDENNEVSKQVVYVSHSKYMFDWDMRKQTLVADKKNGEGTSISDYWWIRFTNNDLPAPLDEIGLNWLGDLLGELNLITEGHSDGYVMNYLLQTFSEDVGIEDILNGFKLIPGSNPNGQFDLAHLCTAGKKKFMLLFDSDQAGKSFLSGANGKHFPAQEVEVLSESPVNETGVTNDEVNVVTIEDFLPTKIVEGALNEYGKEQFSDKWQTISWLHKPDVSSMGIVAAIEKRLKNEGFTDDEIKSFMSGKYFFIISAVKSSKKTDFSQNRVKAIKNFLKNLNEKLVEISSN